MHDMKVIMKNARMLLDDENRWTKDVLARDNNNDPIEPKSPYACSWCLSGALMNVCKDNDDNDHTIDSLFIKLQSYICEMCPGYDLITPFNDAHSTLHSDVLELIDSFIETLE